MHSQDKIDIALQVYHQWGSTTNTLHMLGYPTRKRLKMRVFTSCHERQIHTAVPVERAQHLFIFFT